MTSAESQDLCADLEQALQSFWECYTGVRPAHTRVVVNETIVAVCLEQILTPAEREMASTRIGREMLREIKEQMLEQITQHLQQLIDRAAVREVSQAVVAFDVTSGHVLGFFQARPMA